jgi:hypothetical protein
MNGNSFELIYQLKKKKQYLQRRHHLVKETDIPFSELLTYRIELINILLAEFGEFQNPVSLKNLRHKPKF